MEENDENSSPRVTILPKGIKFPHIEGNNKAFLKSVEAVFPPEERIGAVILEGTVKLHGVHADIVLDLTEQEVVQLRNANSSKQTLPSHDSKDPSIESHSVLLSKMSLAESIESERLPPRFQSRNTVASSANSFYDFPMHLEQRIEALHLLRWRTLRRFCCLYPDQTINTKYPLILGGEWVGTKVQRVSASLTSLHVASSFSRFQLMVAGEVMWISKTLRTQSLISITSSAHRHIASPSISPTSLRATLHLDKCTNCPTS